MVPMSAPALLASPLETNISPPQGLEARHRRPYRPIVAHEVGGQSRWIRLACTMLGTPTCIPPLSIRSQCRRFAQSLSSPPPVATAPLRHQWMEVLPRAKRLSWTARRLSMLSMRRCPMTVQTTSLCRRMALPRTAQCLKAAWLLIAAPLRALKPGRATPQPSSVNFHRRATPACGGSASPYQPLASPRLPARV
jgi:hypothetical protein